MQPAFQLQGSPIFLGPPADAWPDWFRARAYSRVLVIVDENTRRHCLPYWLEQTGLPESLPVVEIAAGEQHKSLDTCHRIWQAMLDAGLDRRALVLNLGGGVIGDMGGFCAAAWKRGVDFVQAPTTLLAMTDASIGGKLGVDFNGIKNAIGFFGQPAAVFIDPVFLKTLPSPELRSGFAEVIKHACIAGKERDLLLPDQDFSSMPGLHLLRESIAVKVRIVAEDPRETGLRMLLNFGHSIGHALESYFLESESPLSHGEAVAIGMLAEWPASARRDVLAGMITAVFPHRHIPEVAFEPVWNLMQHDKKNVSGTVRLALPGDRPFELRVVEATEEMVFEGLRYYNGL